MFTVSLDAKGNGRKVPISKHGVRVEYIRLLSSLDEYSQKQYKLKLILCDSTQLPDPFTLVGWAQDVTRLPDLTWGDMYVYLLNTPSKFTHESMKAFISLEAYNFYVNGHVQDVFYHEVNRKSEFCFVKSEVGLSSYQ